MFGRKLLMPWSHGSPVISPIRCWQNDAVRKCIRLQSSAEQ
eukprot:COSAG04_NODE_30480_length_262_cov_0.938650_1_plen_40_part_01